MSPLVWIPVNILDMSSDLGVLLIVLRSENHLALKQEWVGGIAYRHVDFT